MHDQYALVIQLAHREAPAAQDVFLVISAGLLAAVQPDMPVFKGQGKRAQRLVEGLGIFILFGLLHLKGQLGVQAVPIRLLALDAVESVFLAHNLEHLVKCLRVGQV